MAIVEAPHYPPPTPPAQVWLLHVPINQGEDGVGDMEVVLLRRDVDAIMETALGGALPWLVEATLVGERPEGAEGLAQVIARGGRLRLLIEDGDRSVELDLDRLLAGVAFVLGEAADRGQPPILMAQRNATQVVEAILRIAATTGGE